MRSIVVVAVVAVLSASWTSVEADGYSGSFGSIYGRYMKGHGHKHSHKHEPEKVTVKHVYLKHDEKFPFPGGESAAPVQHHHGHHHIPIIVKKHAAPGPHFAHIAPVAGGGKHIESVHVKETVQTPEPLYKGHVVVKKPSKKSGHHFYVHGYQFSLGRKPEPVFVKKHFVYHPPTVVYKPVVIKKQVSKPPVVYPLVKGPVKQPVYPLVKAPVLPIVKHPLPVFKPHALPLIGGGHHHHHHHHDHLPVFKSHTFSHFGGSHFLPVVHSHPKPFIGGHHHLLPVVGGFHGHHFGGGFKAPLLPVAKKPIFIEPAIGHFGAEFAGPLPHGPIVKHGGPIIAGPIGGHAIGKVAPLPAAPILDILGPIFDAPLPVIGGAGHGIPLIQGNHKHAW